MKLKYYLRGLGVGIFTATILLAVAFSLTDGGMSDEKIMERAAKLGMVMPDGETEATETQTTEARTTEAGEAAETEQGTEAGQNTVEASETPSGADDVQTSETNDTSDDTDGGTAGSSETNGTSDNAQASETNGTSDNAQASETNGTADSADNADAAENADDTRERCTFVINSGEVCRVICSRLAEAGVVDDAEALRAFLAEKGFANSIIAGTYSIPYGADNEEIYEILLQGPI